MKFDTEVSPQHELVALANAASFNNTYFSEGLTTFAQGWRDPSNLEAELEFVAPMVEVPRRFEFRKFDDANDFLTDSDDEREPGGGDRHGAPARRPTATSRHRRRTLLWSSRRGAWPKGACGVVGCRRWGWHRSLRGDRTAPPRLALTLTLSVVTCGGSSRRSEGCRAGQKGWRPEGGCTRAR